MSEPQVWPPPRIERWHNHPSTADCGPQCPAGEDGWDGKGTVIDHFDPF
jgi:hypothetical protein